MVGDVLDEIGGFWFVNELVVVMLFSILLCLDLIELVIDWNVLGLKLKLLNLVVKEFLVDFFEIEYLNFLVILRFE